MEPSSTSETSGEAGPSNPAENKPYNGRYSNPVFKQISLTNGQVNKMSKDELKMKLQQLRQDTRGVKEVLKKRLKHFYQRQKLIKAKLESLPHDQSDFLLVIDFEATCDENKNNYPHEIIEFPVVLVSTKTCTIVDEFHEYCRPTINPVLTPFCRTLTGITQSQVDSAHYFPEVLNHVNKWIKNHKLGKEKTYYIATDGPWDMGRFLHTQCNHCRLRFPRWARKWINVRKCYRNYYGFRSAKLTTMLENLGMEFVGHQHSGIDDARNIARIVIRMLGDGCTLVPNERIYAKHVKENKRISVQIMTVSRDQRSGGDAARSPDDDNEDDGDDIDQVADVDGATAITYSYQGHECTYDVQVERAPPVSSDSTQNQRADDDSEDEAASLDNDVSDLASPENDVSDLASPENDVSDLASPENDVSDLSSPENDVSDLMYWMSLKEK